MRFFTSLIILILAVSLTACSNGAGITPELDQSINELTDNESSPLYISDYDENGNPTGGMGLLGAFTGYIDPVKQSAELTPLRDSSLTDTLEVVDITSFLTSGVCTDCVHLKSISLDADGNPVLTIGVKHPFNVGDPLKPITGQNRGDLHVFNVEGIVAIQSTGLTDFTSLGVTTASKGLINADGLTSYLDTYLDEILLTDATAHPYILHFDDYSEGNFDPMNPMGFASVTTPPPSGNLVMAMGSDYDYQDYSFNIPDGEITQFIYAVGCTYAVSSSIKSQRFSPEYRVPQHNKKAASEVRVEVTSNDLLPGDISSTAELTISILDINHAVETGLNLDQMAHDSSVANILYEIPGITSGIQSDYIANGGDGRDPLDPLSFIATVTNAAGGGSGSYLGLLKVLDSYPTGQNESPLLGSMDGIKRVEPLENPLTGLFDITEFATYALFEMEISSSPEDPIAIIITNPDPPEISVRNSIINLDASSSYDPDGGSLTLYEWDFDWDGVPANFNPDLSGMDMVIDYDYGCTPGIFTCALRVTDDDSPLRVSEIASVDIILVDFIPGNWEGSIMLGDERIQGDFLYVTGQSLQVDSDGWTHIITHHYDTVTYKNSIHHRSYKDGSMSDIDVVPGTPDSLRMVTSAIDNDETLHVVWLTGYPDVTVQHTSMMGGVFTGIVDDLYTETQPDYRSEMMNIQRNDSGHIMATFINYDADKTDVYFMYTINTGAGFSPVTKIPYQIHIRSSDGPNPSYTNVAPNLVATPNGDFHQIFYSKEADLVFNVRIHDLVFDGSAWDPPRVAYDYPNSGATMYDISVCSGSDGDIHITGQHEAGHLMHYVRYDAASDTWLDDIAVANDNDSGFSYGAVEVDDRNRVYMAYTGSDGYAHLKVFCESSDETTVLALLSEVIDNTTVNNEHNHIDLNWNLDGDLMVIYQDTRDTPINLYFNVFSRI